MNQFFSSGIFNEGSYTISRLLVVQNKGNIVAEFKDVLSFDLLPEKKEGFNGWTGKKEGVIKLSNVNWYLKNEFSDR